MSFFSSPNRSWQMVDSLRVYIIIQSTSCFVLLTHFYSLIKVSGGLVGLYQFNSSYLCYITKYFCQHWLRRETKLYTSALIPAVIALLNAGSTRQCTLCMHCAFWVSGWVYRCRRNLPWSYLSFFLVLCLSFICWHVFEAKLKHCCNIWFSLWIFHLHKKLSHEKNLKLGY